MVTSGNVDKTFLGFLLSAAVALFAVISKARFGLLKAFFANYVDTLGPFLPRDLKKSIRPSACIVLPETVIDFLLLQIEL